VSNPTCPEGHELPDHFHHALDEDREPCPLCGSTVRVFFGDVTRVSNSIATSWRVYSQRRPEAAESRETYPFAVELERLDTGWLFCVYDGSGNCVGSGIAAKRLDAAAAAASAMNAWLRRSGGPS
jgi:hypothetical protein